MTEKVSSDNNVSPRNRTSQFDELVVAQEATDFSLTSQWNDISFRNATGSSGTGTVTNSSGSFKVSTGTTAGSTASLVSNQAGVYKPGTSAIAGLGVRLSEIPSAGSFDSKWGYYDSENGFGFGYDATGLYVFFRREGADDKTYQSNWSEDKLDGTGASGFNIDVEELLIYQIDYTWYGAGEIAWYLAKRTSPYNNIYQNRQLLHVYDPYEDQSYAGPSLLQPDLPFTVEVDNGNATEDLEIQLTGRSFRRLDSGISEQRRTVSEEVNQYTLTVGEGTWEPVISFRKTDTFNGFPNEVNTRFEGVDVFSDEDCSFRVTLADDIDEGGSTYSAPNSWDNGASANEVAKGANLSVNDNGFIVGNTFVRGATGFFSNSESGGISTSSPIGRDQAVTVWARPDTGNTTVVDVALKWNEAF